MRQLRYGPHQLRANRLRACPQDALHLIDGSTRLWHGGHLVSVDRIEFFGPRTTGLHLGPRQQADHRVDRTPAWGMPDDAFQPDARMHAFRIRLEPRQVALVRDCCSFWGDLGRAARARGIKALVYLNRFEGIPPHEVQAATKATKGWMMPSFGQVRFSDLTDGQARRLLPSAMWSLFLLDASAIVETSLPAQAPQAAIAA